MISAIIRTKNSEKTLGETLESLTSQTLPPNEIIVVDNGSLDQTVTIANAYGANIIPYDRETFNYSYALNLGLKNARNRWALIVSSHIGFKDRQAIEFLLNQITSHHRCYGGYFNRFPTAGAMKEKHMDSVSVIDLRSFSGMNGLRNYASIIDRKLWLEFPFDEQVPCCEDQIWAVHFMNKGYAGICVNGFSIGYNNPHMNYWKEARDCLVIIHHSDLPVGRNRMLIRFLRKAIIGLYRFELRKFCKALYMIGVLLRDAVIPFRVSAKYY